MLCFTCKYFSGEEFLPCAVNPVFEENCRDYEQVRDAIVDLPSVAYLFCESPHNEPLLEERIDGELTFVWIPTSLGNGGMLYLKERAAIYPEINLFLDAAAEYLENNLYVRSAQSPMSQFIQVVFDGSFWIASYGMANADFRTLAEVNVWLKKQESEYELSVLDMF